uniref:Uncharacterized protein n=1 Tax=Arundo donax TaxID=35708 RepID=A0A0A9HBF2_ARUDO
MKKVQGQRFTEPMEQKKCSLYLTITSTECVDEHLHSNHGSYIRWSNL